MGVSMSSCQTRLIATVGALIVFVFVVGQPAAAATVPAYDYATPIFGIAAGPGGSLYVADAGAGIVELRKGAAVLIAALPGVADIAPIGRGDLFAITGLGEGDMAQKLFRVSRGSIVEIADLFAFESEVNPDGGDPAMGGIDSNPFEVVALSGGRALVADAGANDLLIVDQTGNIDWVATLPAELVPIDNFQNLIGCPDPPEGVPDEFRAACDLPPDFQFPAQPVATSVAIGPDGAYYVGELKGVPAPLGMSRVWRIEPGTLHAECGTSPACEVVATGFTSIVDLTFGPDGTLYVTEIDEASFLAVELALFLGLDVMAGGTVNACDLDAGTCVELAQDLPIPIAVAVSGGTVYVAINVLVPGAAQVIALP